MSLSWVPVEFWWGLFYGPLFCTCYMMALHTYVNTYIYICMYGLQMMDSGQMAWTVETAELMA